MIEQEVLTPMGSDSVSLWLVLTSFQKYYNDPWLLTNVVNNAITVDMRRTY